jgi:hypothetical protein
MASLAFNAYLFNLVIDWQNAWLEQILTTSEIERIYRKSGADITYESIKGIISSENGEFEIVSSEAANSVWVKPDAEAILVNGTTLFFSDGQFIGSKANLPNDLKHWGFGQEEF